MPEWSDSTRKRINQLCADRGELLALTAAELDATPAMRRRLATALLSRGRLLDRRRVLLLTDPPE